LPTLIPRFAKESVQPPGASRHVWREVLLYLRERLVFIFAHQLSGRGDHDLNAKKLAQNALNQGKVGAAVGSCSRRSRGAARR
jgi:hypothetical protein